MSSKCYVCNNKKSIGLFNSLGLNRMRDALWNAFR